MAEQGVVHLENAQMAVTVAEAPELEALTAALNSLMPATPVTILERAANVYTTTATSEVVLCRMGNGQLVRLLCKYGIDQTKISHGHRGGTFREAAVYRHVLAPLHVSSVAFYGAFPDEARGSLWLILEYLDDSLRVGKLPQPTSMCQAADWIGRLHASCEERLSDPKLAFLPRYDPEFYRGWTLRAERNVRNMSDRFPWLDVLFENCNDYFRPLLTGPLSVIHGEYYPANILYRNGVVYPVDWESAAIAAGEIDLAALIEGWGEEVTTECRLAYERARWPLGSPPDFERRFAAAALYLPLRFLGDPPEWSPPDEWLLWFDELHLAGRRLGLI